ncbi:MAG: hypothetical protein ACNI27_07270 [Desulfovibrio sp.]
MTVAQMKKQLEQLPDNAQIILDTQETPNKPSFTPAHQILAFDSEGETSFVWITGEEDGE